MKASGTRVGLSGSADHACMGWARWHSGCKVMRYANHLLPSTMLTLATLRRTLYSLMSARFIELQKQKRRP